MVIASGHRIVDLGTKFTVRREARGLSVAVTEGRVQLETSDARGKPTTLTAGQVALADAKSVSIEKKPADELSTELKWRTGLIEFRYTTLAEAAREFNRYNRTKLVIADPGAAKLTVVGTFGTNDCRCLRAIGAAGVRPACRPARRPHCHHTLIAARDRTRGEYVQADAEFQIVAHCIGLRDGADLRGPFGEFRYSRRRSGHRAQPLYAAKRVSPCSCRAKWCAARKHAA